MRKSSLANKSRIEKLISRATSLGENATKAYNSLFNYFKDRAITNNEEAQVMACQTILKNPELINIPVSLEDKASVYLGKYMVNRAICLKKKLQMSVFDVFYEEKDDLDLKQINIKPQDINKLKDYAIRGDYAGLKGYVKRHKNNKVIEAWLDDHDFYSKMHDFAKTKGLTKQELNEIDSHVEPSTGPLDLNFSALPTDMMWVYNMQGVKPEDITSDMPPTNGALQWHKTLSEADSKARLSFFDKILTQAAKASEKNTADGITDDNRKLTKIIRNIRSDFDKIKGREDKLMGAHS